MSAYLTERQKQFALTSLTGVLLSGVVLLLINILANWVYLRWDLTRQHAYSLSPSSKKLVRALEDPVIIKVYFTPDLPAPYNTYARYVKDILAEYRAASRGRVRYQFVPTLPAGEFENRAMEAGMTALQFEQMGSDQLQIRRGFMGLSVFYHDQSDALPVISNIQNLEYDLTSRIARMSQKSQKRIAATLGHGEPNWRGSALKIAADLPAFYDLTHPVSLPLSTQEPVSADAMLVVGPDQRFDDASLWVLDQTLMRGVPIAFLVDAKRFLASQFMVMPQSTGIESLLKHYGVTLTDRLILDPQCATVGMTQNMGGLSMTTSIRYPFMPLVTRFEKNHPIVRGVESVGLPFASRMDPVSPLPKGVTYTPLLMTSNRSWLAPDNTFNVAPNSIAPPKAGDPLGPFTVGALLEGTFPSFFAGKSPPVKGANVISESPKTSIFVLSTSHILDPNLPEFPGSGALLTNVLAYLAHDDTLIGIQSKTEIMRPLKVLPGPLRDIVKILCIAVVPALVIFWGLARWRRREVWRQTITREFAPVVPASESQ